MKFKSLYKLADYLGCHINRITAYKRGVLVNFPDKTKTPEGSYYDIPDEEVRKMQELTKISQGELYHMTVMMKKGTRKRGRYENKKITRAGTSDKEYSGNYIKALEARQKRIDEEYNRTHGMFSPTKSLEHSGYNDNE